MPTVIVVVIVFILHVFIWQGSRILIAAEKGDLAEILGSIKAGIDVNFQDLVRRRNKNVYTYFQTEDMNFYLAILIFTYLIR
jgi:hypothetical protein